MKGNPKSMRRGQYLLAYVLAALVMMVVSYSVPRWLPGDFVTAMYSSSHVTLNAEQEADLRVYYTQGGISKGIPIPQNKMSLIKKSDRSTGSRP